MDQQMDTADSTLTAPGKSHSGDILPGTLFGGDLHIVSKIGSGGMGSVYLAVDTGPLGRSCAVKILDNSAAGASGHARFLAEARIMASLRHPNIVAVSRFGTDAETGFDYYVMDEFLLSPDECRQLCLEKLHCAPPQRCEDDKSPLTLADLIEGGRSIPEAAVADMALQLLSAIDAAHNLPRPVVHRDIKPSNILFAADGRAMLADFGIAKRLNSGLGSNDESSPTMPNATPGTWMYAAPEQRNGGPIVPATDFYSFGLVLFKALTGGMPNRSAALPTDIAPDVSKSWHGLFARLLDPDAGRRLSDAVRVREVLEHIREEIRHRERAAAKRRPLAFLIGAAAIAAALLLLARLGDESPAYTPPAQAGQTTQDSVERQEHTTTPDGEPPANEQNAARTTDESNAAPPADGPNSGALNADEPAPDESPGAETPPPSGFDNKQWARQYADNIKGQIARALASPIPDSQGRIIVPEGKILFSGDIPDSAGDPEIKIVLDGGSLVFAPSASRMNEIVDECEDFIANAPEDAPSPSTILPKVRVLFKHPIAVTGKGGHLDSADGEITALVAGEIACADGMDETTLSVFGLSSITLNRSSIDPRLRLTGACRIADIGPDGKIRNLRWFESEDLP